MDSSLADVKSRVATERTELRDKIEKLSAFLDGPASHVLDPVDRQLLVVQNHVMLTYHEILTVRLQRFPD